LETQRDIIEHKMEIKYGKVLFFQVLKCKCSKLPFTAVGKVCTTRVSNGEYHRKEVTLLHFR